jgi:biopolymer transport protein ExbD
MRLPDAGVRKPIPISLTALIDVVFILLLFFMLSSSFTQWRSLDLTVDTPGAAAPADPEPALVIELAADGSLRLEEITVGPTASAPELAALLTPHLQRPMVLAPAGDATAQQVVTTLERLTVAGARRLTLANAAE